MSHMSTPTLYLKKYRYFMDLLGSIEAVLETKGSLDPKKFRSKAYYGHTAAAKIYINNYQLCSLSA